MNPIKNKKDLEVTIDEIRNYAYAYLEKYSPSKQQLRTYLLKKLIKLRIFSIFIFSSLMLLSSSEKFGFVLLQILL